MTDLPTPTNKVSVDKVSLVAPESTGRHQDSAILRGARKSTYRYPVTSKLFLLKFLLFKFRNQIDFHSKKIL